VQQRDHGIHIRRTTRWHEACKKSRREKKQHDSSEREWIVGDRPKSWLAITRESAHAAGTPITTPTSTSPNVSRSTIRPTRIRYADAFSID